VAGRRTQQKRIADYAEMVMEPFQLYSAAEIVGLMVAYVPYGDMNKPQLNSRALTNGCYDIPNSNKLNIILKRDPRFYLYKASRTSKNLFVHKGINGGEE